MVTFTSVHDVEKIAASTVWDASNDCSPHITIELEGDNFDKRAAFTFYIKDAVLNARLIEAINSIVEARAKEVTDAQL